MISQDSILYLNMFYVVLKHVSGNTKYCMWLINVSQQTQRVTYGSLLCHRKHWESHVTLKYVTGNTQSHEALKCVTRNSESHMWLKHVTGNTKCYMWLSNVSQEIPRVTCGSQMCHRKSRESHVALKCVTGNPESNDNVEVLHTLQISSLTIRCSLVSYSEHFFWKWARGSYHSAGGYSQF